MALHTEKLGRKRRPKMQTKNDLWKYAKNSAPFVILVIFTAVAGGIFFAIEQHCNLDEEDRNLTYWKSFHYIATIETTIGYGDIVPCTIGGRVVTILFPIIGLPLTLVCLERLGRWLERAVTVLWYVLSRRRDARKVFADLPNNDDSDSDVDVPLAFALFFALFWILFSSTYFYFTLMPFYENENDGLDWNFFSAFYFTIITFFTIGLGDISPKRYDFVLLNMLFMWMGLALVTMCINIVQTKIERLFDNTQKMIRKQYETKIQQAAAGQKVVSEGNYQNDVNSIMRQTGPNWLRHLVSEHDITRLVEQYKRDCQMVNQETQTMEKEMKNAFANTDKKDKLDMGDVKKPKSKDENGDSIDKGDEKDKISKIESDFTSIVQTPVLYKPVILRPWR